MPYTPNPLDDTQPEESVFAGTAAAEFRALKTVLATAIAGNTYEGDWASLTGPLLKGDFVTHADAMWLLKVNLADVTTVEPTLANSATWFRFTQVSSGGYVAKTSETGSALLPSGTTLEQDVAPVVGATRRNSTLDCMEMWNGTHWVPNIWVELGNISTAAGTGATISAIPPWVNNLKVLFAGVSMTGLGHNRMRLGTAGGLVTAGYAGIRQYVNLASATAGAITVDGFYAHAGGAGVLLSGVLNLRKRGTTWFISGKLADHGVGGVANVAGRVDIAGELTQFELFASLNAYDAGSVTLLGHV